MFKRLFLTLALTIALVFGGTFAFARDLVAPPTLDVGQYLSYHYCPAGSVLAFVDFDNDGICDSADIYGLVMSDPDEPIMLIFYRGISCTLGEELLDVGTKLWEKNGMKPRAWDKDTKEFVEVTPEDTIIKR